MMKDSEYIQFEGRRDADDISFSVDPALCENCVKARASTAYD